MSRVTDILTRARDILADQNKQRWTDDTLLRLFNKGLLNFIMQAKTLKLKGFVALEKNTAIYDMSRYAISIDRIQYMEKVLVSKTEEEMDRIDTSWQTRFDREPEIVIFDNLKLGSFRIYPMVEDNVENNISQNSPYGILVDINVVSDLYKVPGFNNAAFNGLKYLTVFYTGRPRTITIDSTDDELDIDYIYDEAIAAYISGEALRLDGDAQNRAFGVEQLSIFKGYVDQAKIAEAGANNTFIRREVLYKGFT